MKRDIEESLTDPGNIQTHYGNCKHEVEVLTTVGAGKIVVLANDEDAHYQQAFHNRTELDTFIAGLNTAADTAWGKP